MEGISISKISDWCVENKVILASVLAAGFSIFLVRRWANGGVCRSKRRLEGKTVLVTGGNIGIGLETARDMARRGARVLIACRDKTKGANAVKDIRTSTGNNDVHMYIMDLASLESVRQCAKEVLKEETRLDILINNAGIMACAKQASKDGYELQFATNHLGHFLFTNLLLDLIKKSAPSRIVNVSSLAHKLSPAFDFDDINMDKNYGSWNAYGRSKVSNVLFTRELAKRLEGTGVTTSSLHPGSVDTQLQQHSPTLLILKPLISRATWKTPAQGAQTSIYCAVDESLDGVSGKYYSDCAEASMSKMALDDDLARKLWEVSVKMTGL